MVRFLRRTILMITLLVAAACQPAVTDLPTFVPEPTDLPTSTPTLTPTSTRQPRSTSTPTAVPILGRFATDPNQIGYVRVVHAAPDTAQIDVYVDSTNLASNVEYGLSTGRTNVLAGDYDIRVTERGVSPDDQTLALSNLTIEVGQSWILVLGGIDDAVSITTVEESNEPLNDNESRVNFVHAVPLAPTVKGQQNGVDLSPLFDFGQQSGGITVSSGESTLTFATSEQTLRDYPVNLFPRTHYTLILIGRSDALETLSVLAIDHPVAGLVTMRVIHAAQAIDAIDVLLNDEPLVENIAYATASDRQTRTDGSHSVSIYIAGDRATPLLEDVTVNAVASDTLSLIVMGSADNLQVLVFRDDLSEIRADTGRIAFVNALENVPAVQVGLDSTISPDIGVIGYGQAGNTYAINLGTSRIFWQQVNGGIAEDVENFLIESGRSYLYLLTGVEGNPLFFSEPVPVSQEVVALPTDLNDTPSPRIRIRIVNATEEGIPVDFVLNNDALASNLAYGQGTGFFEVIPGTLPLTIRQSNNPELQVQRDFRLVETGDYSVFVYGPNYDLSAIALTDSNLVFDEQAVTLRIVNLSLDETINFGLVAAPATDPLSLPITPAPTVPLGLPILVQRTNYRSASAPAFGVGGIQDLIVSDNRTGVIGYRIRSFDFQVGVHYDVIATYSMQTGEIRAFLLQYPER